MPRFLRRKRGMTSAEAYSVLYPRTRIGIDCAPIHPPIRPVQGAKPNREVTSDR